MEDNTRCLVQHTPEATVRLTLMEAVQNPKKLSSRPFPTIFRPKGGLERC